MTRFSLHVSVRRAALAVVLPLAAGAQAVPTAPDTSTRDLEQLMNVEVVVAASKRAQQTRDVPSFVSVVTAADIKAHGYRTLAEILNSLPSFYVINDRNYSYLGIRGFQRPGDYNTRVLLLQNGLRANDNVYDAGSIGEEFVLDVDLIERVEVIRGPSAALYGSNAFFAVINVVTKDGTRLHGSEVATTAASYGTYAGRASYGRAFGADGDILLSASASDSKGRRLYFPEYDNPSTNNGISDGADGERFHKLLGTMSLGNFAFQASNVSREKTIPTGSYGTVFNDPRSRTVDGISLASVGYTRTSPSGSFLSTRVHGGHWTYAGDYSYDPALKPNHDKAVGDWWGVDVDASRALGRNFITTGAEFVHNFRQDQVTWDEEPYFLYTDVHNKSTRSALFVQDELKLLPALTLHAGARYDHYESFDATSPRVGLIFTPGTATTVKLLAGRAFRAPNEFELNYESSMYTPNPNLRPERIGTLELLAQRFIGGGFQLSASGFRNRISGLISLQEDPNDNTRVVFENAEEIESNGVELGVQMNRGHGVTGQLSYAHQRTTDLATRSDLTNSPRHMAKGELRAPISKLLTAGVDAQYVSRRKTLAGTDAAAYVLTNLSLMSPRMAEHVDLTFSIYNLFDVNYGIPGAEEMLQNILQQDGRSFRAKATVHF